MYFSLAGKSVFITTCITINSNFRFACHVRSITLASPINHSSVGSHHGVKNPLEMQFCLGIIHHFLHLNYL